MQAARPADRLRNLPATPLSRRGFLSTAVMAGAGVVLAGCRPAQANPPPTWATRFERLPNNPIITPDMLGELGDNINGPSLIRVPDWVENPLGKYYLYFAHHRGTFIRLAYADDLAGTWTLHEPGTLRLEQTFCNEHIASPDVHVDDEQRRIRMYFHGRVDNVQPPVAYGQRTFVAVSPDGLEFTASPEVLGPIYFRGFQWNGWQYALTKPGHLLRSRDPFTLYEEGPYLFGDEEIRHMAVLVEGDRLRVFYSRIGDAPERIRLTSFLMKDNWKRWQRLETTDVLEPATEYEGADLSIEPSEASQTLERVRELRDPAVYTEDGSIYLVYSIAGEVGLAIARADYL